MLIFLAYTTFPSLKTKQSWQKTLSRLSRCHTLRITGTKSFLFFCYYTISKSIQSRHALHRILIFVSKYTFIEYISLFLHLFHLHLLEQTQFVHPPLSHPSLSMLFCILCYQAQICIRDLLMPIKETANTVDRQLYFDFKFD